ncbi:alpha/beta fold hydrolase [Herbiconiux sp. KACC 21604]|uniref:alpha/beta hydrolase family protein n=1 Tax=unclassified Herbiconiux TaxID=2618217 RepID=UPI00149140E3|nr:alpha/beta fold hydrolase [Herbiconiux sp. SALV-R1]QJU52452.1 alpha/beta fold hydrolase [Herbiconiux sp. SALV-R1]WPO87320.1 alpha/beta fold hydrolase [Herbiconiux sp. KACC 21604]
MSGFAVTDDLLDAQTLRAASTASFGGAEVFETVAIARRVKGTDFDSWHAEWNAAAEAAYAVGVTAESRGERETARLAFLRATTYFRTAGSVFLARPVDPRLPASIARQREAFRRAITHFDTPVETVEIPYEGTTLPGYFFSAVAADAPDARAKRATVVLVDGYDGTTEELYFWNARAALDRGYNVLAFDGPGQGSVLVEQGLPLRPDYENVVTPVIDWLLERDDVDPARVALIGLSLGGYLAPRAASGEHRVAACIADSGAFDLFDAAVSRVPKLLRGQIPDGNEAARKLVEAMVERMEKSPTGGWALRRNLYAHDVDDTMEFFRVARSFTLRGFAERITCPTLVVHAEGDDIGASAPELYDALTCEKEILLFTAAQSADQHCETGARQLYHAAAFSWLDSHLHPTQVA